jgi:hypothetical protein
VNLDGKRMPLGSIDGVKAAYCSWSEEFITCPTGDDFRAWRFVA